MNGIGSAGEATRLGEGALADPGFVDQWRVLAEKRSNPFLTPEWMHAWTATNPDEEPFVIGWRVDGELRGVLPLVRVSRGPLKLLRFPGARRGDWFGPACRKRDEEAMASACADLLSSQRSAWHLVRLDRVEDDSPWPAALWQVDRGRIGSSRPQRHDVLPCIEFGEGGYQGYLAGRSRNFRSQLGRRQRKLEREHGLTFRMTTTEAELDLDLDTFFRLHDERWAKRGGSSSAAFPARAHQRAFAAAALERGWLRLWTAEADGEAAASWYGWRVGERYCYSLSGLKERYEPYGLGTIILAHTIEQAAEEGAAIYDLMWGDESYKHRFETGRRHVSTWVLARRGHPAGPVARLAGGLAGRAARLPSGVKRPLRRISGRSA